MRHGGPRGLVQHWDGARWQTVPGPDGTNLESIAALSAHDIWVVGESDRIQTPMVHSCCRPLVAHWDGRGWTTLSSTQAANTGTGLHAVIAVSARDVWAVGNVDRGLGEAAPLIQHWDGTRWQVVRSPTGAGTRDVLAGVAASSARDVWAVGGGDASAASQMLVEQWDGHDWHVVLAAALQ